MRRGSLTQVAKSLIAEPKYVITLYLNAVKVEALNVVLPLNLMEATNFIENLHNKFRSIVEKIMKTGVKKIADDVSKTLFSNDYKYVYSLIKTDEINEEEAKVLFEELKSVSVSGESIAVEVIYRKL